MKIIITKLPGDEYNISLQGKSIDLDILDGSEFDRLFKNTYRAASNIMESVPAFHQVSFSTKVG